MRRPPQRSRGVTAPQDRSHHRWGGPPSRRAQSTTLDYVLTLGVTALVITGLVTVTSDFVNSQREQVIGTELSVVGEQITAKLVAADTLVRAGNHTDRLVMNGSMPRRVAGVSYTVSVTDTGSSRWLNLTSHGPDVAVAVKLETGTEVATGSVSGGNVDIVYDPTTDRLEVRS